MENISKGLVGLAAIAFVLGVIAALVGGYLYTFPAESFSRASANLALVAIALMMMNKK